MRIGFYTGNIYDKNTDVMHINECALVLEPGVEQDKTKLALIQMELKQRCHGCSQCGEAKKGERNATNKKVQMC